ncbi:LOW QUALITY PROTEIN: EF-hand calcium-binding domain-containing protein 4B [Pterocles gutturalis]
MAALATRFGGYWYAGGYISGTLHRCLSVITPKGETRRGDCASPVPPGDAETGEQDPGLAMLGKAHEFFQICDLEGKGVITCQDIQILHPQLPSSLEELEKVFVTLDADGNVTPKEFMGFRQFILGQIALNDEVMQQSEGEIACPLRYKETMSDDEDEEFQFSNLIDWLGDKKVLDERSDVKQLWMQLRKDEPHLLSSFEEFVVRIFSQLQEADNEKNELECALKMKVAAYDEEIQHLYEEMEEQIKKEKEQFILKIFLNMTMDHVFFPINFHLLDDHERQFAAPLEKQCTELLSGKEETKVENTKLKLTNQELLRDLERTSYELSLAQQELQVLQEEASRLHEEKKMEVYRVLQREKSGLLKQMDFLRNVSFCLLNDDVSDNSKRRNSAGLNGILSVEPDAGATGGMSKALHLKRIISIEEDHLPQLPDRLVDKQLNRWPVEDDNVSSEVEVDKKNRTMQCSPSSSGGQPVGKETLSSEEIISSVPDHLFKIIFVGNSSVGKTFLRFCEDHFFPGTAATVGVDYNVKTITVDNSQVVLQLWDTAGWEWREIFCSVSQLSTARLDRGENQKHESEKTHWYQSITKQFFRKADGVIVIYDITAKDTFTAVKQWLISIKETAGENVPVLLLGNKTDNEKECEVSLGMGEHLGKDYNLIFYECSACSGYSTKQSVFHLARILKDEDRVKEKNIELQSDMNKKSCCIRP